MMNERIQELADLAEDYADGIVDQGGEFHPAYTEKLAELIVRECIDKVDIKNELVSEVVFQTLELAKRRIRKHFEVE
jgi:hypothetical protein